MVVLMDPIAVLSLACNVLQVVELGCELAAAFKQIYQNGTLEGNVILSKHAQNLREAAELVQSATARPENRTEAKLLSLAQECTNVAGELQNAVASTTSSSSRRREKFKAGFKAIWNRKDVEKLAAKLRSCQDVLDTRILFDLRSRVDVIGLDSQQDIQHLEQRLQKFIHEQATLQRQEHELTRSAVHREADRLVTKMDDIQMSNETESQYKQFICSLTFPGMNARKNQISDAHVETFEWIFKSHINTTSSSSDDETFAYKVCDPPWSDFVNWLCTRDDIYWISGKPGSGKSTLMSFIYNNSTTRDCLKQWASPHGLCIADAYFWNAGVETQRSVEGLLATLASQVFTHFKVVTPELFCHYPPIQRKRTYQDWSKRELKETLDFAIQNAEAKFCFFVDGLDEVPTESFDAQRQVLRLVQELSSYGNVKLCVSSRPLRRFESSFQHNPRLRLEQLNEKDIKRYYDDNMKPELENATFTIDSNASANFRSLFISKAEGIFLWACLAVNSLKRGFENLDTQEQLLARLDEMPDELEEMYEHMWKRNNPDGALYRAEAATIFRRQLLSQHFLNPPLTILSLTLSMPGNERIRSQCMEGKIAPDLSKACELARAHVLIRCSGMLDISPISSWTWIKGISLPEEYPEVELARVSEVTFIHRTAKDFLEMTPFGQDLISHTSVADKDLHRDRFLSMLAELYISKTSLQYEQVFQLLITSHFPDASHGESDEAFLLAEIEQKCAAKFLTQQGFDHPNGWFAFLRAKRLCLHIGTTYVIHGGKATWLADFGHALDFLGATLVVWNPSLVKIQFRNPPTTVNPQYCQYLLCCSPDEWFFSHPGWRADSWVEVSQILLQLACSDRLVNGQTTYNSPEIFYFPIDRGVAMQESAFTRIFSTLWQVMCTEWPDISVLTDPIYPAFVTLLLEIEPMMSDKLFYVEYQRTHNQFHIGYDTNVLRRWGALGAIFSCNPAFLVSKVYEGFCTESGVDPESNLWTCLQSLRSRGKPRMLMTYKDKDGGQTFHKLTEVGAQMLWSSLENVMMIGGFFRPLFKVNGLPAADKYYETFQEVHERGEWVDMTEFFMDNGYFKDLDDPDVSWYPPPMYLDEDMTQYELDRSAVLEAKRGFRKEWKRQRRSSSLEAFFSSAGD